ncbi:MAG TPA: M36 family metallopeptidase, partial [Thermoanaerobaculia bacterium]|nr:M36 family metallopeptidase [Thermoanaerobaculia bacterium]
MRRHAVAVVVVLLSVVSLFARDLPNIDKFGEKSGVPGNSAALLQKAKTFARAGLPLHDENRLGVPTFLWVSPSVGQVPPAFRPGTNDVATHAEDAARSYLGMLASLYNLSPSDVSTAKLRYIHDVGRGPVIVKLEQSIDGVEIFREEINVVMNRKLDLVAVTGYISSAATPPAQSGLDFRLDEPNAAITAVRDLTLANVSGSQFVSAGSRDGYDFFTLPEAAGAALAEPVRMKKVFFHVPEGLIPAYYVEVIANTPTSDPTLLSLTGPAMSVDGYAYVVSAVDGSILFRKNLSANEKGPGGAPSLGPGGFTYRVWADPVTGVPGDTPAGNAVHPKVIAAPDGFQAPMVAPSDVTLPNYPFSMNDPWLPAGATETVGNNVDAYLNLFSPDGYGNPITAPADPPTGDYRANRTAVDQFLHTHVPDTNSTALAENRQGAIQQLFYNNNFLHDWFYDSGFNEASGNAQTNNFGRGGLVNDSLKAQADDFQSFSNANMLTPADGTRPRMRMYVFPSISSMLDVSAPPSAVGKYQVGISMSGPQAFDLNGKSIIKATFVAGTCNVTNAASL